MGLEFGIFCYLLYSVRLLNAFLGLDFLMLALSWSRWCTLFTYRAPDPEAKIYRPTLTGMVPRELAEGAKAAGTKMPGVKPTGKNLH